MTNAKKHKIKTKNGTFLFVLESLSIIINFACLLKLWFVSWRCLYANMVLGWGFLTSFM